MTHHSTYPGTDNELTATTVVASPTGRYIAVSRDGQTDVRDATSGQVVGSVAGSSPLGFSGDADASLLAVVGVHSGGAIVWDWARGRVVWTSTQAAQWAFPDPGSAGILVGVVHGGELDDFIAVSPGGQTVTLGTNAMLSLPCPCPVGAGLGY